MNLLMDDWIPVQREGVFRHIDLETLLTQDENWQISLPRDDMEMACLQLLVSLTQVLFTPKNKMVFLERITTPISGNEYINAVEGKVDWFDLDHPEYPFMQIRGVEAEKTNPMMKLFAGFTESTSSAFVNEPGLADLLCPSCAVIGLFNQANNCASFCGGAKGSIRGNYKQGELKSGVPITTFIQGDDLRKTIWMNVLSQESFDKYLYIREEKEDFPNWVDVVRTTGKKNSIKQGEEVLLGEMGLLRGLFWQPQHIELVPINGPSVCNCCGTGSDSEGYSGFKFEKFSYKYLGFWMHPHSPSKWEIKKGEKQLGYISFSSHAPPWSQLSSLLLEKETEKDGHTPSSVVSQFKEVFQGKNLNLIVGGYWTKPGKASIIERRHEILSLASGWDGNSKLIIRIVDTGLAYKTELRKKLYGFFKATGASLQDQAEHRFYKQTEALVHSMLRDMDFKESKAAFSKYHQQLRETTRAIFKQVIEPYQNEPKMIKALATARRGLEKSLNELN